MHSQIYGIFFFLNPKYMESSLELLNPSHFGWACKFSQSPCNQLHIDWISTCPDRYANETELPRATTHWLNFYMAWSICKWNWNSKGFGILFSETPGPQNILIFYSFFLVINRWWCKGIGDYTALAVVAQRTHGEVGGRHWSPWPWVDETMFASIILHGLWSKLHIIHHSIFVINLSL